MRIKWQFEGLVRLFKSNTHGSTAGQAYHPTLKFCIGIKDHIKLSLSEHPDGGEEIRDLLQILVVPNG